MDCQTTAQLRLEPGSLGRHDIASIGYPDKLLHGNGIQCESCCHLTRVNPLLELAETSDTAYEVNTLRSTEILDVEELVEDKIGADGHIEASDGIVVIIGTLLGCERVPVTSEVHREVVQVLGLVDLGTHVLDLEVSAQLLEELLGSKTVEILHNAVVVDNLEVALGEYHCHEVVVLLCSVVIGILTALLLAYESGCSRPVVTVGNVECRNGREYLGDPLDIPSSRWR